MTLLALSILVFLAWVLWAVGGVLALHADKLEHKRPKEAGFSFVPIIPLFPVVAILVAVISDLVVGPWGTRAIAAIHVLLVLAFLVGIARELFRVWSVNRRAV
jgi:hypothetical protein